VPIRIAPFCVLAVLIACAPATAAEDAGADVRLPHVVVLGTPVDDPGSDVLIPGTEARAPAADGGELLRTANGVSAGRIGGRGLDPVIRGQGEGRLNVLIDGAYVFGACPNRMDPPSSFAATHGWDRIIVLKGVQSLLWGGGGSGGTVLYEREPWPARDGATGQFGAASTSNDTNAELFGDVAWATRRYFLRSRAQYTDAGNYEDGNGDQVRSAYRETAASLASGFTLSGDDRLELLVDATRAEDVLYSGAGMDAPKDDSDTYRLSYETPAAGGELTLESWYAKVHHFMDNYSLRPLTAPMALRVPARSRTVGGRALFERAAGGWDATFALDYLNNDRHATRFQGTTPGSVDMVNSFLWPGASLTDLGVTVQGVRPLAAGRLTAGLRYDHVEAGAGQADHDPASPLLSSPDELYRSYYGRPAGDENEDHVSWLLRYERPFGPQGFRLFAGLSRTVRTADATERYMAMNNAANPAMRWVGNPGLDPEDHRQVDLGFTWRRAWLDLTGAVFFDDVRDFITPDRARGQDGILQADGARIYRNVDAQLVGAELEGRWRLAEGWEIAASAAWVRGENTADDRPLPQIPPLNGMFELLRAVGDWEAGGRLRWADRQSRVDDDPATGSGLDADETPGHAVLDLFWRGSFFRLGDFGVGVDNLFDKTWADHLNGANQDPFNPDPVQVNEPGRVVWANWRRAF
jgi:iron complex outermembrane receptor protein